VQNSFALLLYQVVLWKRLPTSATVVMATKEDRLKEQNAEIKRERDRCDWLQLLLRLTAILVRTLNSTMLTLYLKCDTDSDGRQLYAEIKVRSRSLLDIIVLK